MEKRLENLTWQPRWMSHMGCLKGCIDYLNMDISDAWLYGGTGLAFVINLPKGSWPSGPTALETRDTFQLLKNIGLSISGISATKEDSNFSEKQKAAWDLCRQSIDQNLPCCGFDIHGPEYAIVNGYNEIGYFFSAGGAGAWFTQDPKKWDELGLVGGVGWLQMYRVEPSQASGNITTVSDALSFALDDANRDHGGTNAYDRWIEAFNNRTASTIGTALNAGCWTECRAFAVEFLKEAKQRVGEKTINWANRRLKRWRK